MYLLFVAMLMPNHEGSGEAKVLGVYTDKKHAESRCYRELNKLGYNQPTEVVECTQNVDLE